MTYTAKWRPVVVNLCTVNPRLIGLGKRKVTQWHHLAPALVCHMAPRRFVSSLLVCEWVWNVVAGRIDHWRMPVLVVVVPSLSKVLWPGEALDLTLVNCLVGPIYCQPLGAIADGAPWPDAAIALVRHYNLKALCLSGSHHVYPEWQIRPLCRYGYCRKSVLLYRWLIDGKCVVLSLNGHPTVMFLFDTLAKTHSFFGRGIRIHRLSYVKKIWSTTTWILSTIEQFSA